MTQFWTLDIFGFARHVKYLRGTQKMSWLWEGTTQIKSYIIIYFND